MTHSPNKVIVHGSIKSDSFQRVSLLCHKLKSAVEHVHFEITPLAPMEYLDKLEELKLTVNNLIPKLYPGVILHVIAAGKQHVMSSVEFTDWVMSAHQITDVSGSELGVENDQVQSELQKRADAEFEVFIRARKLTIVYMDVQIGGQDVGRLWVELYSQIVPNSVTRFVAFVNGNVPNPRAESETLGYKSCTVNRIIREGWFQVGEFLDSKNAPIFGELLPDENFIIPHAHRGNISFVNKGPHSNYSQFMITQRAMPYFDRKFVCIGRVVDGDHVLQAIDETKTRYEKPTTMVRISKAVVLCEGEGPAPQEVLPTFF